jgi:hypothetical protein
MQHCVYNRISVTSGVIETLPFAEVDGLRFKAILRKGGYDGETALLIVNRWNYISARVAGAQTIRYFYTVPTVEGAL